MSAEGYAATFAFCHGISTAPAEGEAGVEYRRGCDTLMLLGFAGYWPAGDAPGEGEERLALDELAAEHAWPQARPLNGLFVVVFRRLKYV